MNETTKLTDWAYYKRLLGYVFQQKALYFIAMFGFCVYASTAPMLAHLMDTPGYDISSATDAVLKRLRGTDNNYEFLETLTRDM